MKHADSAEMQPEPPWRNLHMAKTLSLCSLTGAEGQSHAREPGVSTLATPF